MHYFFKKLLIFFVSFKNYIPDGKSDVCMIGHRGHSDCHVDNTEESFLAAVKNGSGGIETDVRITSDNKLILCHNDDAEYADGTRLNIADSTYEELTSKPLKNTYTDSEVYLCSLRRYIEICRDNHLVCFIEFKGKFTDELTQSVFNLAREMYDLKMCSLQSFNMDNLIRAHELFPELPIMYTYGSSQHESGPRYDECIKRGFDIDADYYFASRKMVRAFHDASLKVGIWTCNDIRTLNYAHFLGVDYIESNVFGGNTAQQPTD